MILPNVREKTIKPRYANTKGSFAEEENPYYEGNLKSEFDKEFLHGYDFLAEEILPMFFDNIYMYEDELAEVGVKLRQNTVEVLKECLADYVETQRNDTVVYMIEKEN